MSNLDELNKLICQHEKFTITHDGMWFVSIGDKPAWTSATLANAIKSAMEDATPTCPTCGKPIDAANATISTDDNSGRIHYPGDIGWVQSHGNKLV